VNRFDDGAPVETPRAPDYTALAAKQIERLRAARASRDTPRTRRMLAAVAEAARTRRALMEAILEAVRARATVGEITAALEQQWGRFGTSLTTSSRAS
jgi:methylmalonyl-CoA mutase N-terminal domain/subunit